MKDLSTYWLESSEALSLLSEFVSVLSLSSTSSILSLLMKSFKTFVSLLNLFNETFYFFYYSVSFVWDWNFFFSSTLEDEVWIFFRVSRSGYWFAILKLSWMDLYRVWLPYILLNTRFFLKPPPIMKLLSIDRLCVFIDSFYAESVSTLPSSSCILFIMSRLCYW